MKLLKHILHKSTINRAVRAVKRNGGAAGIDGMTTGEVPEFFERNYARIKRAAEDGSYCPQQVRGIEIPKASGGTRLLGIPSVIDRTLQQAVQMVLSAIYEPDFSPCSYGFRPGKSARQAVHRALDYINEGFCDIIELDLKNFFDVVNHDCLMSLLYAKIKDEQLLRLIRKYLQSGILLHGVQSPRTEGTPQGSPLSPLLSNILLNELDKELERDGIRFVRYADDVSIFLKTKREAVRVLRRITRFIEEQLHLKVNREKTRIVRPVNSCILGFNFVSTYQSGTKGRYRLRVCPKNIERLKLKIKDITRKTDPAPMREKIARLNELMRGWVNYFKDAAMHEKLVALDTWIRSRLRYCIWKHWKKPNRRMRAYIQLGVAPRMAYSWSRSRMGGWAVALSPMMKTTVTEERLRKAGYRRFADYYHQISPLFCEPLYT